MNLTAEGGSAVITSPNYPEDYNNHDRVEWIVDAGEGNVVEWYFNDFQVCLS